MRPLDPVQVDLSGTRLIEASAGTGKTYTITTLYLRLIIEQGLSVDRIVVVTFTKAATAELRGRIRDRLREAVEVFEARLRGSDLADRPADSILVPLINAAETAGGLEAAAASLRAALRGFDEASIYTIHGFCQRVLQENAFESGLRFDPELDTDSKALLAEVAADFWTTRFYAAPDDLIRYVKARRLGTGRGARAVTPAQLAALANLAVAEPGMPILPTAPFGEADLERAREAFAKAHATAASIWAARRDAIRDLVLAAKLHGGTYKAAFIESKWPAILDDVFARPRRLEEAEREAVEKYTPEYMTLKVTGKSTLPVDPFFDACAALLAADADYEAALAARFVALEVEFCDYARRELARRKKARNALSYDDLIQALARALDGEGGERLADQVRGRYQAALIDEFQDTDADQYRIFSRIWHDAGRTLFLIGDPKQAIYSFRGADIFAYMLARRDAGEHAYTLTRNWRSDPGLIAGVNALFEGVARPFLFPEIEFTPVEPANTARDRMTLDGEAVVPFRILHAPRSGDVVKSSGLPKALGKGDARALFRAAVADDIVRLLASGTRIDTRPVEAGDVAVLCRSNREVAAMKVALDARGVPSVVHQSDSVFVCDEAVWLERLLGAIAEPTSLRALRAAMATPLVGVDATTLAEIDARDTGWDDWLERFEDWNAVAQRHGPIQLLERVAARCATRARLLGRLDGERRLTNLLHLAELLQSAAAERGLGPHGLASWLGRMRSDERARSEALGDAEQQRLESDARAVQLVTIHRSKGLQYGVVYCTDLWDGELLKGADGEWIRFHDPRAGRALTLDLGSDRASDHAGIAQVEAFAEAMRVAYVALTRARHQVVCAWGAVDSAETSALSRLLHAHAPPDPASDPTDPGAVADHAESFRARSDAALAADLEALAIRSGGRIRIEAPDVSGTPDLAARHAAPVELRLRRFERRLDEHWRTSSFSGLASSATAGAARPVGDPSEHPRFEGRDYDSEGDTRFDTGFDMGFDTGFDTGFDAGVGVASATDADARMHAPVDTRTDVAADAVADAAQAREAAPARVRLHAFPAGAGPGTMIHKVFELIDFEAGDDAGTASCVERTLQRFGMPAGLATDLRAGVQDVLATPLVGDADGLRLNTLPRSRRLDELEFLLPAAHAGRPVQPRDLAECLRVGATRDDVIAYAARVEAMAFRPLAGYLRGFIDLVFAHAGRFYVVDYKSNRLGDHVDQYAAPRMAQAMADHDYILQYHLYCVAVHRYLERRLPDYDYDRHFGGAYYLFLRGMAPDHPAGCGIHHDRPARALVEGLSACFGGGAADSVAIGGAE